ncbi:MAG TPA: DUF72 domain-containing protein [Actinomycetota bacterium]|nr:DUF72 domain-containing protein [Actinomycetota bacterium]
MDAIVGTSGWQYRDWRGSVYPEDLPASRWLGWYAERFPSVEVNNTFYRLPERTTFERWADAVPDGFLFAVKASRFITHVRRLADVGSAIELLLTHAAGLGDRLGPILFQLPPNLPRATDRLERCLAELPPGVTAAVEFRHPSWLTAETFELLERAGAALVWPDRPRTRAVLPVIGRTIYVRFHQGREDAAGYTRAKLRRWADRIAAADADVSYLYFNNDEGGAAVRDAHAMISLVSARRTRS